MTHYQRWQRNMRVLRSAGITARNVNELEEILEDTHLSIIEGLVELGVTTGYLSDEVLQALIETMDMQQDPETGIWRDS